MALRFDIDPHGRLVPVEDEARRSLAGASSMLCCPPKTEAALKLHRAGIPDPALLAELRVLDHGCPLSHSGEKH